MNRRVSMRHRGESYGAGAIIHPADLESCKGASWQTEREKRAASE